MVFDGLEINKLQNRKILKPFSSRQEMESLKCFITAWLFSVRPALFSFFLHFLLGIILLSKALYRPTIIFWPIHKTITGANLDANIGTLSLHLQGFLEIAIQ